MVTVGYDQRLVNIRTEPFHLGGNFPDAKLYTHVKLFLHFLCNFFYVASSILLQVTFSFQSFITDCNIVRSIVLQDSVAQMLKWLISPE